MCMFFFFPFFFFLLLFLRYGYGNTNSLKFFLGRVVIFMCSVPFLVANNASSLLNLILEKSAVSAHDGFFQAAKVC